MQLSEEFKEGLNEHFQWEFTNIPNLDVPVLIIFQYSPRNEDVPFSFAFNLNKEPKCWMSHDKVKGVENSQVGPNPHEKYRKFNCKGYTFYPYSVQVFPDIIFQDINKFKKICCELYEYIDQE